MFRYQNTQLKIKNKNLMQCNASIIGILLTIYERCYLKNFLIRIKNRIKYISNSKYQVYIVIQ